MTAPVHQSSSRFRAEREGDWLRLESLLDRVEKKSAKVLSDEELLALPLLYRSTLSALSVARATSLDRALVSYLEWLSTRAYFFLYGTQTGARRRITQFFRTDWPAAMRALWRETLVMLALLLAGAVAGYALVASDPTWFGAFVDSSLAGGRGPEADPGALRAMLYDGGGGSANGGVLGTFATYLFTHNAGIALMAFALGFALGVPTVLLVLTNGCMLGAFIQVYVRHGLGWELGGWLAIHGTTELFAIVLSGAAGLRIGMAAAFPGERTRLSAMAQAGRVSGVAVVGVVLMLLVAGLLEGIGRQTITSDTIRYTIGLSMLALWCSYYYLPRRSADGQS